VAGDIHVYAGKAFSFFFQPGPAGLIFLEILSLPVLISTQYGESNESYVLIGMQNWEPDGEYPCASFCSFVWG